MHNIEFKDEYWEQALDVLQEEENWLDAQSVLRRAERKEFVFRIIPYASVFLLVSFLGLWMWTGQTSEAQLLKSRNFNETNLANIWLNNSTDFIKKDNASQGNVGSVENENSENFKESKGALVNNSCIATQKNIKETKTSNKLSSIASSNHSVFVSKKEHQPTAKEINAIGEKHNDNILSQTKDEQQFKGLNENNKYNKPKVLISKDGTAIQQSILNREKYKKISSSEIQAMKLNLQKINNRDYFSQSSSIRPVFVNNSEKVYPNLRPQLNGLSFVFGTSQFVGFGSDNHGRINPELGIEYQRYVSKNIFLTTGITYFNIEGLNHEVEFSDVQIGFSKTETKYSFSSNKVHYLFVPLQLTLKLNCYHSINLGAAMSYFLTNNGQVELSTFENEIQQSITNNPTKGYASGYRPYNASLVGGYELALNYKTSVGIQYQFGLNPIVNEDVYTANNKDRNSRLRILVKRKIR